MLKKLLYVFILLYTIPAHAQTPEGLMTDLLAHPDMQVKNGYRVPSVHTKAAFLQTVSVKIASKRPAFSWTVPPSVMPKAYRILLTSYPDTTTIIWDSKKSAFNAYTARAGKDLQPNKLYAWKVKIWNSKGIESNFSAPSIFFTDSVLQDHATAKYPLLKTDQLPMQLKQVLDTFRIDFGKAAFGQLKVKLHADKDGDAVLVRLGEAILPNGSINRKPGGTIRFQQYSLPLKAGTHTYEVKIRPDARNTGPQAIKMPEYIGEVLPFRYCEIEGYKGRLQQNDVIRAMVNYPFDDNAAEFDSPDTILNAVWDMCKYSMKATSFAGTYVDGDRERIPYEADAYINQLGHYAVDREFSLARSSQEYLLHHATWPTEWILQSVLMAWHDFLYTGDPASIKYFYDDIKAKLLMPLAGDSALISTRTGKQNAVLMQTIHYNGKELRDIVDWPHTGILGLGKSEGGETDGFVFTDYNTVVNAYYYAALNQITGIARSAGRTADVRLFMDKAGQVKKKFRELLWDENRKVFRDGIGTDHASLHANMFALAFGLVEEKDKEAVMTFIRSRGMACSVYGSQFLMDAVYEAGDGEYGLQLLHSQDERSWYNMIRAGSTIAMEAWDNKYKPNQDWNHAWGAVPANIIPRRLMGIEPIDPGWGRFRIRPQIGSLPWATLKLPTVKGTIYASYTQTATTFVMKVTIPGDTRAFVQLPCAGRITVNGVQVEKMSLLESGTYEISVVKN